MVRIMAFALIPAVMIAPVPACMAGGSARSKAEAANAAGAAAYAKGDIAATLMHLAEAIRLDPTWEAPYQNRAKILFSQGNLDRALTDCDASIRLAKKGWPQYHMTRALVYRALGEHEKSLADVCKAVELAPDDPTLRSELGMAYAYAQKFKEAIEECSKALKANPRDYESLVTRAAVRCKTGDSDGGMADFTRAIQIGPKEISAYMERAYALFEKGNTVAALKDCDRVLAGTPRDFGDALTWADVRCLRGRIHRDNGDGARALSDFSEALRLNPKHARALIERGRIHGEKGDFKKAVADFSEHIRYYPNHPAGYEMRGLAYLALGNTEAAAADQRKLQELSKKAAAEKDAK